MTTTEYPHVFDYEVMFFHFPDIEILILACWCCLKKNNDNHILRKLIHRWISYFTITGSDIFMKI